MQQGYDPEGNHFGNYAVNGSISNFAPQFVFCAIAPQRAIESSFTMFIDHTQRRTTVSRTPLD